MRAITRQRYTRFLHIAKHGTKTGKGLRSSHGFFPSEVSNNMLCDLGRMSRGSAKQTTAPSNPLGADSPSGRRERGQGYRKPVDKARKVQIIWGC
jgi:hypothetical protein